MEERELWGVRALFSSSQKEEINPLFVFVKGPSLSIVCQLSKISRQPRKSQTLQLLPKECSMLLSHYFYPPTKFQQVPYCHLLPLHSVSSHLAEFNQLWSFIP